MNVPVHFRNSDSIVPFDIHTVVRVLLKIHNIDSERAVVLFLLVPLALHLYICYESITVT